MTERGTYKKRGNIIKRGKTWYIRIFVDGRDVWRAAGRDRKEAQQILGRLRADADRGKLGLGKSTQSTPTLSDFRDRYMKWAKAHKRSWKRDEYSLAKLEPVFGDLRLPQINKARVESYQRDRLAADVKGATINREVACLRKILSYAVEIDAIETNPLLRIKMLPESAGRIPVLDVEDEARLLQNAPPWLRLLARLAVATGARQGELMALKWRDVDLDVGILTITDSKSGDSRRVPIHPTLLDVLKTCRGLPEALVITLPNGKAPSRYSVTDAFKRAARTIGRGELRFHDLRHIAGSRLLGTGASLPEVAAMLGHKTLAMSKRYTHVSPVRLRSLIADMPMVGVATDNEPESRSTKRKTETAKVHKLIK